VVGVTAWATVIPEEHAALMHQAVPDCYLELLDLAGLAAVLIPVHGPAGGAADMLGRVDGLVLTGGGDVAPGRYAAARAAQTAEVDPRRDDVEIELVRLARQRDMPVLAICRGIQLLNVALGGTLLQDLPTADPPCSAHMALTSWNGAAHAVRPEPGTMLHRLLGPDVVVNSLHHQAVDRVAPGLRAAARAPDGVIEAVEDPAARFVVGLQWHPEMLGPDHPSSAVFTEFGAAVRAAVSGPPSAGRRQRPDESGVGG
jgi:putative glutamine amidotransferase